MNLTRIMKLIAKVQGAADKFGVNIDISDEQLDKWLNTAAKLASVDMSSSNETRVSELASILGIELPQTRLQVIENVLNEVPFDGSALDLFTSGYVLQLITRQGDGSIQGEWVRESEFAEPRFVPSTPFEGFLS